MKNTRNIMVLVILLISTNFFAQTKSFSVNLAPFSSLANNEFSPVYYKNGIVFCSDLKNNSIINYKSFQKKLFNIYLVETNDSIHWKNASLLANELTTNYNDGPVTFNDKHNIIYYCRNNDIRNQVKDFSDTLNKLGIYSAELIFGEWTNIKPFTYNNPLFSFLTPALTANGLRLYFASDMPGGFGGTDLYYCDWNESDWDKPVNLGPVINTSKNESYPFACNSGKLFFASDGLSGFGGKDIYYSQYIDGKWLNPVHPDAGINSPDDDFGLITDVNFSKGYFSSNRRETDDIFTFKADDIEFTVCDSVIENSYCFLFYDEYQDENNAASVTYKWSFSDGTVTNGLKVKHCFPGPGKYIINLDVIDDLTDSLINRVSYNLELEEIRQAYINSPDAGIINTPVSFDGLQTNLPDFKISDYLWNLGNGFNVRGPVVSNVYKNTGEYTVQLGLLGSKDSLGNSFNACVYKKINIYEDYQEMAMKSTKEMHELDEYFTAGNNKISDSDSIDLINIEGYRKEKSDSLKTLIYLLDELSVLQKDKIFEKLYKPVGMTIEMNDSAISNTSKLLLNMIVKVLKEDQNIKIEIAVHYNENGFKKNNLEISEKWALMLYSYFLDNGITDKQIHTKGYGDLRPAMNKNIFGKSNSENRVEFIFMNKPN